MIVNRSLMELMRSDWLMSFSGIMSYAPIAYKIMMGESATVAEKTHSIMTVMDDNGKIVAPNKDGFLEPPKGSVAIIDMIGPAFKYGDWCTYGTNEICDALYKADRNTNIIGTVFNVDGPGGGVNAISPLIDFGKNKTKPVIGLADQCASLHFWGLNAVADHKMAANNVSAEFGSVGVVASFWDNRKYMKELGYEFHEIYPEESKHKNEAFRLALEGKYDMIKKEHLSPLAIKFQDFVRDSCPKLKEEVGVLTGKMFSAEKALEYGMIDSIGNLDRAVNMLHIMSETNHYN